MEITTIYAVIIKEILSFYHSTTFAVIKFLLAVYVIVLVVDLVLLIIQRNIFANVRQIVYGANMPSELAAKKDKLKARWDKIKSRLASGNEAEYKVAIIEADEVIDDLIMRLGYKGENMAERLAAIPSGQIAEMDEIKEAHKIRNRIIHEEKFKISREKALATLAKYEHFLRHFEVLD